MADNKVQFIIEAIDKATKPIKDIEKTISSKFWDIQKWFTWFNKEAIMSSESMNTLKTTWTLVWGALAWLWFYAIKMAWDIEQTNIAFQNLYWGAEKANEILNQISDFAAKTPFEFPELADVTLKLKQIAWVTDQELIPTLTALWDLASSQWKWISQTVEAYNDAIVWEFERLKEFWIRAEQNWDKVKLTFKWQTVEVHKTKEAIWWYLQELWWMEWIVGWMEKQSKTLNWRLSTLKDTFNQILLSVIWVSKSWEIIEWGFFDKVSKWIWELQILIETNKKDIQVFVNIVSTALLWVIKVIWFLVESYYNLWSALWYIVAQTQIFITKIPQYWQELKQTTETKFLEISEIIWKWILDLIQDAKQWWSNLLNMFVEWLSEWIKIVEWKIIEIAQSIKDYLWFGSPTKKWPNSDSDKRMPNLIKMMTDWLSKWYTDIDKASAKLASAIYNQLWTWPWLSSIKDYLNTLQSSIKDTYWSLNDVVDTQKDKLYSLRDWYSELKNKLKEIWSEWVKDLKKIEDQLISQEQKIKNITWEWKLSVAERALELEWQLWDLKKEQSTEENQAKIIALQEELKLAEAYAWNEAIEQQRIENAKNETQVIIDRINQKLSEAEIERQEIQKTLNFKKISIEQEKELIVWLMKEKELIIQSELITYKNLIQSKQDLDNNYFNLFEARIIKQTISVEWLIEKLKKINTLTAWPNEMTTWISWARATWWPVNWWNSYLVWEKWPEIFTPISSWNITPNNKINWWNTININLGWVVIQKEADENRLIEKLKKTLINEVKLYNIWIS